MWTQRLLRYATTVTAVDAAPEMLAVAAARFGDGDGALCRGEPFHRDAGPSLRRGLLRLLALSRAAWAVRGFLVPSSHTASNHTAGSSSSTTVRRTGWW